MSFRVSSNPDHSVIVWNTYTFLILHQQERAQKWQTVCCVPWGECGVPEVSPGMGSSGTQQRARPGRCHRPRTRARALRARVTSAEVMIDPCDLSSFFRKLFIYVWLSAEERAARLRKCWCSFSLRWEQGWVAREFPDKIHQTQPCCRGHSHVMSFSSAH